MVEKKQILNRDGAFWAPASTVRATLALLFAGGLVLGCLRLIWITTTVPGVSMEVAMSVLGILSGIAGTITGYYFGAKRAGQDTGKR